MMTTSYSLGRAALLFGCAGLVLGIFVEGPEAGSGLEGHHRRFQDYIQKHGRTYKPGTDEYEQRFALFRQRVATIEHHNNKTDRSWSAVVNHLTDRTDEELKRLRGYKRQARLSGGGRQKANFLSQSTRSVDIADLPTDWSWVPHLTAMRHINDQGPCGSCWAFATATVLRAHSELYQRDRSFSVQQMVSCTPNPNKCGGSGGCDGATAELAMDYVSRMGLSSAEDMMYYSRDEACPYEMRMPKPTLRSLLRTKFRLGDVTNRAAEFGMMSWRKLPDNRAEPLVLALYEQGPVITSVMASESWNSYGGGILDSCEPGAVINHAVTLVGYGEDNGKKFWQIQNSWGPSWGESGCVRLFRRPMREENEYCGWDKQPDLGTGCQGGPSQVYVCGSCGILYDSVVPTFRQSEDGWLARNRRDSAQLLQTGANSVGRPVHA